MAAVRNENVLGKATVDGGACLVALRTELLMARDAGAAVATPPADANDDGITVLQITDGRAPGFHVPRDLVPERDRPADELVEHAVEDVDVRPADTGADHANENRVARGLRNGHLLQA